MRKFRKAETEMKASPKHRGDGYITVYRLSIGSNEARRAGFVSDTGELRELEKVVDEKEKTITFRVKPSKSGVSISVETPV